MGREVIGYDYLRPTGGGRKWSTKLAWSVVMSGNDVRVGRWSRDRFRACYVWMDCPSRKGLADAIREGRAFLRSVK